VLVFLNLLATQWPDRQADALAGKRTLSVRWNARRLQALYAAGTVAFVALSLAVGSPVATIIALPLVIAGGMTFTRRPHLPVIAMIAYLLVSIGVLIS
jgi:1,4-dihydroxy-2-naphthoate octaprenyltransferase